MIYILKYIKILINNTQEYMRKIYRSFNRNVDYSVKGSSKYGIQKNITF